MKYIRSIMAVLICLCVSACGSVSTNVAPNNSDNETTMNGVFRYADWGDSLETVASLEKNKCIVKEKDMLAYEDVSLLTYNTEVVYSFKNNECVSGFYIITDVHTNDSLYIEDFKNIDNTLEEKYGQPIKQDTEWSSELLKDAPGLALFMGDVKYVSIWQNEKVEIMHTLSSDNHEIEHVIFYVNPQNEDEQSTAGL